jgi:phosphoglycolate phosphatase
VAFPRRGGVTVEHDAGLSQEGKTRVSGLRGVSPIDHVFFDLDGTLADSLPGIRYAVEEALAGLSVPRTCPDLRDLIGPPIRSILSVLAPQATEACLDRLERGFRLAYDRDGWSKTAAYPGALDAIAGLARAGKTLFLVTNKPRHVTLKVSELLRMRKLFSAILTRDSKEPPYESKGAMLRCILSLHGVHPATCLMVGDALEDCEAAAHAGMRAAVMLHGYGARRVPRGRPGWRLVNGFEELAALCVGKEDWDD